MTPLSARLVVQPDPAPTQSQGGLYLTGQPKPHRGTVLAVGPGKLNTKTGERTPLQVQPGEQILYTAWAGDGFKNRTGQEILIMDEADILAVVEDWE